VKLTTTTNERTYLPPGTELRWIQEDGETSYLEVTPEAAINLLRRPVPAWPTAPVPGFMPEPGGRLFRTKGLTQQAARDAAVEHAEDVLWDVELKIRKFLAISPGSSRHYAILTLFGSPEDRASLVKAERSRCATDTQGASRQGLVMGAIGGLVVGSGLTGLLCWLKK